MCTKCKQPDNYLDAQFYLDDNTLIGAYCANCTAEMGMFDTFPEMRGSYKSELSGADGAVRICQFHKDHVEPYFLTREELTRYYGHTLSWDEVEVLSKKHPDDYMLGEDFYCIWDDEV